MLTFLTAFFIFYVFHAQGITLGYHRILSHKSLTVPKWLEYLIVSGAYLSLEGAPIFWVTTHRVHHRYSDHDGDPHAPRDGIFHSFGSWMWKPLVIINAEESKKLAPDLYRDPVYRFLHLNHSGNDGWLCLFCAVAFRVAIYLFFGPVVLMANLLATLVSFMGPLLVNSVGHLPSFGYQTYDCGDSSRNVWFVGLIAMGEGWHNNHHAFPASARHGLMWWEFDATWVTISILRALGLAKDIRLPKSISHLSQKTLDQVHEFPHTNKGLIYCSPEALKQQKVLVD
jgi:fatty-acid desaturase